MLDENFAYTGPVVRRLKLLELRSERIDFLSRAILPWHGTLLIASLLEQEGYEVEAIVEGVSHFDDALLADCDMLLVHLTAGNLERTARMVERIKRRKPMLVIGGGGLTKIAPAALADACDIVVRGEGEDTIVELVAALNARSDIRQVAGISVRHSDAVVHTGPRAFTKRLDVPSRMSIIRDYRPLSVFEQLRQGRYFYMTVEASRGCPFACKFCITPDLYGSYRNAGVDRVMADIADRVRYSNRIWFIDNLFVVKRDFVLALLRRMAAEGYGKRGNFTCFLRVENSTDEEVLPLMRPAGFKNVFVGFESLSSSTQAEWNKSFRGRTMADAVARYHEAGLRVQGSFIFGSDDQVPEDIRATQRWAIENDVDFINFYVLIATQMGENACIPRRRMLAPSWDFVNGNYVTHFPLRMPPSVLQETVRNTVLDFYHPMALARRLRRIGRISNPLAYAGSTTGIYATLRTHAADLDQYTSYLRTVERPYYDAQGQLVEDRLPPQGIVPGAPYPETPDAAVRIVQPRAIRAPKFRATQCNEAE